jgi:hypothetical protein
VPSSGMCSKLCLPSMVECLEDASLSANMYPLFLH